MTVGVETPYNSYTYSTLVDVYAFTFTIQNDTDLVVQITDAGVPTILQLNVDYSVRINTREEPNPGWGDITILIPQTDGAFLEMFRDIPVTQKVDWVNNDPFDMELLETAFDKTTLIDQDLADNLGRSIQVPPGNYPGVDFTLPAPEADRVIGVWDNPANKIIIGPTADEIAAAQGHAEQAATEADRAKDEADRAASMFTTPRTWTGGVQNYSPIDLQIAGGVANWDGVVAPFAVLTLTENVQLNKLQMALQDYLTGLDCYVELLVINTGNFTIAFDASYVGGKNEIPNPASNGETIYLFRWRPQREEALYMSYFGDS